MISELIYFIGIPLIAIGTQFFQILQSWKYMRSLAKSAEWRKVSVISWTIGLASIFLGTAGVFVLDIITNHTLRLLPVSFILSYLGSLVSLMIIKRRVSIQRDNMKRHDPGVDHWCDDVSRDDILTSIYQRINEETGLREAVRLQKWPGEDWSAEIIKETLGNLRGTDWYKDVSHTEWEDIDGKLHKVYNRKSDLPELKQEALHYLGLVSDPSRKSIYFEGKVFEVTRSLEEELRARLQETGYTDVSLSVVISELEDFVRLEFGRTHNNSDGTQPYRCVQCINNNLDLVLWLGPRFRKNFGINKFHGSISEELISDAYKNGSKTMGYTCPTEVKLGATETDFEITIKW